MRTDLNLLLERARYLRDAQRYRWTCDKLKREFNIGYGEAVHILDALQADQPKEEKATMTKIDDAISRGEILSPPDDTDPLPSAADLDAVAAEQKAADATKSTPRSAPIPGKCTHCSKYWSAHRVVGNSAYCRGEHEGKTFSRATPRPTPDSAPAPQAAVLAAEVIGRIKDYTDLLRGADERVRNLEQLLGDEKQARSALEAEYHAYLTKQMGACPTRVAD
jgi:hypothetical protein